MSVLVTNRFPHKSFNIENLIFTDMFSGNKSVISCSAETFLSYQYFRSIHRAYVLIQLVNNIDVNVIQKLHHLSFATPSRLIVNTPLVPSYVYL